MIATMRAAPGVGLAAPQVAVGQRIAVIEYAEAGGRRRKTRSRPSPSCTSWSTRKSWRSPKSWWRGRRACLSLPGYAGTVQRHNAVTVKALNRKGRPIKIKARGWLARIFQHEIDHLDGVLFIDRATGCGRRTKSPKRPSPS